MSHGGKAGGWSAELVWPNNEWQLATICKEDGSERLGCRIVTSTAVASAIHKVFDDNRLPSILVDTDGDAKQDVAYIYVDAAQRIRAELLLLNKLRHKIAVLPQELVDLLNLSKIARSTPTHTTATAKTNEAKTVQTAAKTSQVKNTVTKQTSSSSNTDPKSIDTKPIATINSKSSTEAKPPQISNDQVSQNSKNVNGIGTGHGVLQNSNEKGNKNETTQNSNEKEVSPSVEIPGELWCRLKSYQREGVLNFIRLSGRMYLADDPGLGKTLQAIVCASFYKKRWPVLIVCPSTVKDNWCGEFCRWLQGTGFSRSDVHIISSEADACRVLPDPSDSDLAAAADATSRAALPGKSAHKRRRPPKKQQEKKRPQVAITDADVERRRLAAEKRKQKQLEDAKEQAKQPKPVYQVYIISYDLLIRSKVYARVSARRFKVIVSDESHFLKNPGAQRTVSFVGLAMKAPHVLELSGTPGYCPEQIFSQMRALQPNLFPPFWVPPPAHINNQEKWRAAEHSLPCTFAGRWCDPTPEPTFAGKFTWALNGCSRLEELNAILKEFCLLKRCKNDVLKELPDKVRHPIHFEVPANERQIIETELAAIKGLRKTKPHQFKERFMKLFNDLPRVKTPAIQEYLGSLFRDGGEMAIDTGRKVLIFAHHKAMVAVIEEVVQKYKYGYIKITGATPTKNRQQLVDQFQTDPEIRVAILSITAAGFGLNLQAASLVIFAELLFSPSAMIQCEDRSHRLGQKAPSVICRYLLAKGTLDEGLLRMVQRKTTTSALMIEGKRDSFAMKRAQRMALSTDEADDDPDREVTEEQIEEIAWDEAEEEQLADFLTTQLHT